MLIAVIGSQSLHVTIESEPCGCRGSLARALSSADRLLIALYSFRWAQQLLTHNALAGQQPCLSIQQCDHNGALIIRLSRASKHALGTAKKHLRTRREAETQSEHDKISGRTCKAGPSIAAGLTGVKRGVTKTSSNVIQFKPPPPRKQRPLLDAALHGSMLCSCTDTISIFSTNLQHFRPEWLRSKPAVKLPLSWDPRLIHHPNRPSLCSPLIKTWQPGNTSHCRTSEPVVQPKPSLPEDVDEVMENNNKNVEKDQSVNYYQGKALRPQWKPYAHTHKLCTSSAHTAAI